MLLAASIDHLRAQGIRPLVIDWGDPNEEEQRFNCSTYMTQRLLPALGAIKAKSPLLLAGYCMGGLLALALAQHAQERFAALALLATPWNFHSHDFPRVPLGDHHAQRLHEVLGRQTTVPGEIIQTLFYATNPWLFARKFAAFNQLSSASEEAEDFVAIESWVNDNVDMAAPVARECLIDWVQDNLPAKGAWDVGGATLRPQSLQLPTFAACPAHDTIVPPNCAEALLPLLNSPTVIRPASGHVGMVAGGNAKAELWQPFCAWVDAVL